MLLKNCRDTRLNERRERMKRGIGKAISTIAILTMTFQIGMPMVPELQTTVFATDTTNLVEEVQENIQPTTDKAGTIALSESAETTEIEEISRNYEIKEEETWDISANGDGSVMAKWTLKDRTLTISGTGEMKNWNQGSTENWHNTQYTNAIEKVMINEGITNVGWDAFSGCSSLKSITIPESVTSIGSDAFYECSSLESVIIGRGIANIGEDAISKNTIIYTKSNTEGHRYAEEGEQGYIIDDIAPTVNVGYSTKNPTNKNVNVTITSNEEVQAVQGWTLSSDKKTLTKEYSANTKEAVIIKDLVGNETQATIEINNIDKTGPSVNVGYSTKNPTRENVTVTITANEEIQAVQGWTLSSDKKTLTKEYTENTRETIMIKDLAGNETQVNIEISNIDKNLPEITIGDINQDGKIDVTDFLMLKRHLVAGNRSDWKLTGDNLSSADMNENETVDITDMLMLKRVIVENI